MRRQQQTIRMRSVSLAIVLGLLATLTGLVSAPHASAQLTANVAISSELVQDPDGTFFVDVILTAGTTADDAVAGVAFSLSYDPSLLKPILNTDPFSGTVDAPACDKSGIAAVACGPRNPDGLIRVAGLRPSGLTGEVLITRISFMGLGTPGVTNLVVSELDVASSIGEAVPATSQDGTITLGEPAPVDTDGDGVPDVNDLCSGSVADPAPSRLKRNRNWTDSTDLSSTFGCSASQIIADAGLGNGHIKFGISKSALATWLANAG